MQRDFRSQLHVGLIMDGNGRWATARNLSRSQGHEAGVKAIRPIVDASPGAGVGTLTLYAFSSDNWRRPKHEIAVLMGLLRTYLDREIRNLAESGVRLTLVGRRDRLPGGLAELIATAEARTAGLNGLHLRIAFDYSARDMILAAAAHSRPGTSREEFSKLVTGDGAPDVDLLIRTGGEQRLSDFMLWESAYAELRFVPTMWPDFGPRDLDAALADFRGRERRFGGLSKPVAA